MADIVYSNPSALMAPHGPYTQVVRAGDTVYLAGQAGRDASGALVGSDVVSQGRQAFENIRLALESEGLNPANVVKLTIYIAGAEHARSFAMGTGDLYPEYFPGGAPAATFLIVAGLFDPEMLVEIDAIAVA